MNGNADMWLRNQVEKASKDKELQIETSYQGEKEMGLQPVGRQRVLCSRAHQRRYLI